MRQKSIEQLKNSLHNLSVSHDKLCAEYWVIRAEGGYDTAQRLYYVCNQLARQIKEINAELLVREALEEV